MLISAILQSIDLQTIILPLAVMAFAAAVIITIVTPMITQIETPFFLSFLVFFVSFFVILFVTDYVCRQTNSMMILFVLATPMIFGTMSLIAYYVANAEIEKAVQVGMVSVFISTILLVGNILLIKSKPRLAPNPEGFVENQADQTTAFRENCQKGNYLVGFNITSNEKGITSIQGIYHDGQANEIKGKLYGKAVGENQKKIAEKGFAVSGIDGFYNDKNIMKIRVSFLPVESKDESKVRKSEWFGTAVTEGTEKSAQQKNRLVTGYSGRLSASQIVQVTGFYGKQANQQL